jgi:hypothetical protein
MTLGRRLVTRPSDATGEIAGGHVSKICDPRTRRREKL